MPDAKRWWDSHYAEFVKDLRLLLEVPSVSEPNGNERQPYGSACAQVLERMAAIAIRFGFAVTIQDYQYLLADWGDRPDSCIGIFSHLDVVPAGEGWSYPPFGLTELGEVLIGRGASDNKGPALACLYAAAYLLQERGFSPRHSLRLFYGVNEEKSMQDIQHFLAHQPMPRFSLVPDAAFPVCPQKPRADSVE